MKMSLRRGKSIEGSNFYAAKAISDAKYRRLFGEGTSRLPAPTVAEITNELGARVAQLVSYSTPFGFSIPRPHYTTDSLALNADEAPLAIDPSGQTPAKRLQVSSNEQISPLGVSGGNYLSTTFSAFTGFEMPNGFVITAYRDSGVIEFVKDVSHDKTQASYKVTTYIDSQGKLQTFVVAYESTDEEVKMQQVSVSISSKQSTVKASLGTQGSLETVVLTGGNSELLKRLGMPQTEFDYEAAAKKIVANSQAGEITNPLGIGLVKEAID